MLTKSDVHAIRALTKLATFPNGQFQGAAVVAAATQSPPNYLGKLLQMMAKCGLVESQKGLGGGFRLARRPGQISIYDIVEAIDGVGRFARCIIGSDACSDENPCTVHHRWEGVRAEYLEMLRTTTVADLLEATGQRGDIRGAKAPQKPR